MGEVHEGCEECQRFGNIQLVSAAMLHPIIKPWPFRGWGLDFVGQIHPHLPKDTDLCCLL
jgi:hypothetical protein